MFWEVIRDLKPKKTEEKTPVIDMNGNRIEEKDQIIEETKKYYQKLLQTREADGKVQQEKECILDMITKSVFT